MSENLSKYWKDIKGVLHYQRLFYVSKTICFKLINRQYNNPLVGNFGMTKIHEFIPRKYFWPMLCHNVKVYIKACDICLLSKTVCHKLYDNFQSLLILTYWWKDLLLDFVTNLLISTNWKENSYDLILIIIDYFTKMIDYKQVKVTINITKLAKMIIDVIVRQHGLPEWIIGDRDSLFTSKFRSSFYSFLEIKWKLSTTFYP